MEKEQIKKAIERFLSVAAADPYERVTDEKREKIDRAIGDLTTSLLAFLDGVDAKASELGEKILATAQTDPPETTAAYGRILQTYEEWRQRICAVLGSLQDKADGVKTESFATLCRDLEIIGRKLLNVTDDAPL